MRPDQHRHPALGDVSSQSGKIHSDKALGGKPREFFFVVDHSTKGVKGLPGMVGEEALGAVDGTDHSSAKTGIWIYIYLHILPVKDSETAANDAFHPRNLLIQSHFGIVQHEGIFCTGKR